jgi:hypothetical protein
MCSSSIYVIENGRARRMGLIKKQAIKVTHLVYSWAVGLTR